MKQDYKATEAIVQYLCAFDCSGDCTEELVYMIMQQLEISKQKARAHFAEALLIWEKHSEIDQEIMARSLDYDFERIGFVEKGILRYALFALQDNEVNTNLVLKEAMRIAKKFSSPHSAKYVNAILDAKNTPLSPV